jgi:hypothetical protein
VIAWATHADTTGARSVLRAPVCVWCRCWWRAIAAVSMMAALAGCGGAAEVGSATSAPSAPTTPVTRPAPTGPQGTLVVGQVQTDRDGYVEFTPGDAPVVLVAPHGGTLVPSTLPDRRCSGCVTTADLNTQELARAVADTFYARTGTRPHLVINRLHRRKFDANRDRADATGGTVLRQTDDALTAANAMATTSVARLASTTRSPGDRGVPLLRGPNSLGALLVARGVPAVPSPADPAPRVGEEYFTGGYNTERHGSLGGGPLDAVQIESHFAGVRDNATNRGLFARALVDALLVYLGRHYGWTGNP